MTVSIKKWGNSLAVRIPRDIARSLHIENDSLVELHLENNRMIVEPKRESLLEELVEQITPDNLHGEIDTEGPVGHEAW
jgi:antitoxin MazE